MIEKETGLLVQNRAWGDLGDWLGLEDEKNDKSLLWEAYFIYDLELMNKIATILGKQMDAERFSKLYAERKTFFNKTYIRPNDGKTIFSSFLPKNEVHQLIFKLLMCFRWHSILLMMSRKKKP